MKSNGVKMAAVVLSLLGMIGCTDGGSSGISGGGGANSGLSLFDHTTLDYRAATGEECPSGGGVYSLYIDQNTNGVLDVAETVIHAQSVCNGQNGSNGSNGTNGTDGTDGINGTNGIDGYTTLFLMTPVLQIDTCISNSGLQISFGLDSDRSGTLEATEITQSQVLCNGANGEQGSMGAPGANGLNAVFQVVPAPLEVCPAGGSTILMALDAAGSGVYSAEDPGQQSATICHGINGTDGIDGLDGHDGQDAPISEYTTVEPIMPCGNSVSYKEVLLRLGNGQVLASFSDNANGKNTRFAFIPDGSYVDTDGSSCNFQLSTSPDGHTRYMSWFNQVQKTWAMP